MIRPQVLETDRNNFPSGHGIDSVLQTLAHPANEPGQIFEEFSIDLQSIETAAVALNCGSLAVNVLRSENDIESKTTRVVVVEPVGVVGSPNVVLF